MTSRIFFAVDVHGSTLVWRKWINARNIYGADILILSGDLTGKVLVPIVDRGNGTYTATYFGRRWVLRSDAEVKEFMERLENAGAYYRIVGVEELEEMKRNPKIVEKIMFDEIGRRLRMWLDLLVEKIDTRNILTIVMPGNDDEIFIDNIIKSYEDRGVIYPLDRVVDVEGLEIVSSPYVNPTPWNTPREMDEGRLEKYLDDLISRLHNPSESIFNFHCPPHGTNIDLAPKLTKDLRPVAIAGMIQYEHVGSKAVRRAIERYQPVVGLHGHIHESGGIDRIGRTVVVNPGSEYSEGVLRGFIIELDGKRLVNYWRVEG